MTNKHTVTRNGNGTREVTLHLEEKKIQKGDYGDTPYLALPDVDKNNIEDIRDFLGDETFFSFINQPLNQLCIAAMKKAATYGPENEEGFEPILSVNWEKAIESIQDLSARGETKEDMLARRDAIVEQIVGLSAKVADNPEVVPQILNLGKQKKELDEAIKARSESWKRRLAGKETSV